MPHPHRTQQAPPYQPLAPRASAHGRFGATTGSTGSARGLRHARRVTYVPISRLAAGVLTRPLSTARLRPAPSGSSEGPTSSQLEGPTVKAGELDAGGGTWDQPSDRRSGQSGTTSSRLSTAAEEQ